MADVPADQWEGHTAEELGRRWHAPSVHLFRQAGSTNDICRRLAAEGAPEGTVVLSEEQTAGRGREGKRWESPSGGGLWISFLARAADLETRSSLPLVIGVSTAECLDRFVAPLRVNIKWPNDLQIRGLKIGGILCESVWHGASPVSLIVGIGLNLRQQQEDFPAAIREVAGSLRSVTGRDPDRLEIASSLVPAILSRLSGPLVLSPAECSALQQKDTLRGRRVHVTGAEIGSSTGWAMGIEPDGALLLHDGDGTERRIYSGTVRTT